MKTLVYQYYRDHTLEERKKELKQSYLDVGYEYWEYSRKSIEKYAELCGSEYKFLSNPVKDNLPPFFGIFEPFYEGWCHEYDSICFIDSDILATVDAKNIFDYASEENISAHLLKQNYKPVVGEYWLEMGGHFNSGVVVFPRAVYDDLIEFCETIRERYDRDWANPSSKSRQLYNHLGGYDQSYLNFFIQEKDSYTKLEKEFNYHLNQYDHKEVWEASLIHFHRLAKKHIEVYFKNKNILK